MKKILLIVTAGFWLSNAGAQGSVIVGAGANFVTSGTINVTLTNTGLTNDGTLQQLGGSGTSAMIFGGTDNAAIGGSGTTVFSRMMVAKGSGTLSLNQGIAISSELVFASGLLDLGNKVVTLNSGGVLWGESENSHAITAGSGYIETSANLNAPSGINVGNLGAIISSAANLGPTLIRRGNVAHTIGSRQSIERYYDISPANNNGLNATLRFMYLDAELNGLDPSTLSMQKSEDGVTWTNQGYTSRATAPNYVEKTGIDGFSFWTLAAPATLLAVKFTEVKAVCSGDGVLLAWKTVQELNASRFDVERSADAIHWQTIATVAAGNSATGQNYQYKDLSAAGNEQYRIVEYDVAGKKTISAVMKSSCATERWSLQLYPNPVADVAVVNIVASQKELITYTIVDQNGRILITKNVEVAKGSNAIAINTSGLSSGAYTLKIKSASASSQIKFIK